MTKFKNQTVRWLLQRARGQGGIVAVPDEATPEINPEGDFPPGVQGVLNHLIDSLGGWTGDEDSVDWSFLVGGPGNGKSEALRTLASALDVKLPRREPGAPTARTVPGTWPDRGAEIGTGVEVAFINDASVPREDDDSGTSPGSLYKDIRDGLDRLVNGHPLSLFGNINRGILIEEQDRLAESEGSQAELIASIIRWLNDPGRVRTAEHYKVVQPVEARSPYYGCIRLEVNDWKVSVHAVFLDTLSLLEPSPGQDGPSVIIGADGIEVRNYSPFGCLTEEGASRGTNTVAGDFLGVLVEEDKWVGGGCISDGELCPAFDCCPFAQNAGWVRQDEKRDRLLDLFRAAEVAAGHRFTYRDLLANYSRSLIGTPEDEWLRDSDEDEGETGGIHPCEWVQERVSCLEAGDDDAAYAAGELIGKRIYDNLFPPLNRKMWKWIAPARRKNRKMFEAFDQQINPSEGTAPEDPFDEYLGRLDPSRDVSAWGGLRKKVLDAVEAIDVVKPTVSIRELESGAFGTSELEEEMDALIREEIENEEREPDTRAAKSRARLLRLHRSVLLQRQVGVAAGKMSHRGAVESWLGEQGSALEGSPWGSRDLQRGLKQLVFPTASDGDNVVMAPNRPRTEALRSIPDSTVIVAVTDDHFVVRVRARGDSLLGEVATRGPGNESDDVIATVLIDLAIAREALLQRESGQGSFTEISSEKFARIERARAALASSLMQQDRGMLYSDETGEVFAVRESPSSKGKYRIQRM